MKKIFLVFLIGCLVVTAAAQTDQRTTDTKVTDILARYPYQNAEENKAFAEQTENLDKEGLAILTGRLQPPGKGDNTAAEYAIMSYTFYIAQKGKDLKRKEAIEVYGKTLENTSLGFTRDFLILQLEIIGNDEAIPYLKSVFEEENLGERAVRAVGRLNTAAANKTLIDALKTTTGRQQLAVIEMLGINGYAPAEKALRKLAVSSNEDIAKTATYALAGIASASSAKSLKKLAKASGFNYSNTNVAGEFANYVLQLAQQGHQQKAAKLAADYLKAAEAAGSLHARIAGLNLISKVNGASSLPLLMRAVQDNNIEYRAAALALAKNYSNATTNNQWLGVLANSTDEAKVQILDFLSNSKDPGLTEELKKYLNSNNQSVKIAAIHAVGQTGGTKAASELMNLLKGAGEAEINAIQQELLSLKGSEILPLVQQHFAGLGSTAQTALLEVIGKKKIDKAANIVFSQLKASDASVRKTAFEVLPEVVEEKDLNSLYALAATAGAGELPFVQKAMIASIRNADKEQLTGNVISQMEKGKADVYFPVLTSINTRAAYNALKNAFDKGNVSTKKQVIAALGTSSGKAAADILLSILHSSEESLRADIATALVSNVARSANMPSDQKILLLREAMDNAAAAQKRAIIREAGKAKGLPALIFAAEYLDNEQLKPDAGSAVMSIALSDPSLNGAFVRNALEKAKNGLRGLDSEYQRTAIQKHLDEMPSGEGFVAVFNGKDLTGWKGLVANPVARRKMSATELKTAQEKADELMRQGWIVENGLLIFTGKGDNIATVKDYGDIEMYVDWKITSEGDAGIYLRGTPQVQIWDTSRVSVGAQVGSGGLYNNQKNPSKPLVLADNAISEWNTFRIIMKGEKVTVYLNGVLVVDNVTLENYWDRNSPIFPVEQIELQAHGTYVAYRNIFIKELNDEGKFELSSEEINEGYKVLFDGTNLHQWQGNKEAYIVDNGTILVQPGKGSGGNLFTNNEYSDFIIRFEFQLTPGANNGLGIRAPLTGDAAYEGMELQILDNDAPVYKDLKEYQYHGSVYGVIPAKRGYLKPTGEWNYQEVYVKGPKVKVTLNGTVILDGDINEASKNGTLDNRQHPGLQRDKGHIGFLGHGSVLRIKNVRVKELRMEN